MGIVRTIKFREKTIDEFLSFGTGIKCVDTDFYKLGELVVFNLHESNNLFRFFLDKRRPLISQICSALNYNYIKGIKELNSNIWEISHFDIDEALNFLKNKYQNIKDLADKIWWEESEISEIMLVCHPDKLIRRKRLSEKLIHKSLRQKPLMILNPDVFMKPEFIESERDFWINDNEIVWI